MALALVTAARLGMWQARPVASCHPGPSRENPLRARDHKATAPEVRGAIFLINRSARPALLPRPSGCPSPLFSFPCGSWAFISSFQNRTRPGPGLLCPWLPLAVPAWPRSGQAAQLGLAFQGQRLRGLPG